MNELKQTLTLNVQVPKGMVVFLPSYSFQELLFARWKHTGLLTTLDAKKRIFQEKFEDYVTAIKEEGGKGAMLFSVMGGKLSEGINFSDDLARCVVVVGLPFPNRNDPELKAKMDFLGERKGKQYYENQCWKSVNQSIGRAIRYVRGWIKAGNSLIRIHTDT